MKVDDAGFKNTVVEPGATLGIDVEVVTKDPTIKGFQRHQTPPYRTHPGWLVHHRRLVRHYETHGHNSAGMITLAMIDNLTKRIAGDTTVAWRDLPKPDW